MKNLIVIVGIVILSGVVAAIFWQFSWSDEQETEPTQTATEEDADEDDGDWNFPPWGEPPAYTPNRLSELEAVDDDELSKLLSGDDTELAICAAWVRMRRLVSANQENKADAVEQFLDFLETQLEIAVPEFWVKALDGAFRSEGRFFFEWDHHYGAWTEGNEPWQEISKGFQITKQDSVYIIEGDQLSLPLHSYDPERSTVELSGVTQSCDALAICPDSTGGALLGFSRFAPGQYPILRMNKEGIVVWENEVWCIPRPNSVIFMGFMYQATGIVVNDRIALVFGIANSVGYIEGFDLDDGSKLFRFSSYLPPKPSEKK